MLLLMVIHSDSAVVIYYTHAFVALRMDCLENATTVIFDGNTSAVVIITRMLLLLWDWINGKCDHNGIFDGHTFSIVQ